MNKHQDWSSYKVHTCSSTPVVGCVPIQAIVSNQEAELKDENDDF